MASNHVGWGNETSTHNLFVLLDQLHYATDGRLVLYSRTYFIEGRYSFAIVRGADRLDPGPAAARTLTTAKPC